MNDMSARKKMPQSPIGNVGSFAGIENHKPTLPMNSSTPFIQSQYGTLLKFYPSQTVASTIY